MNRQGKNVNVRKKVATTPKEIAQEQEQRGPLTSRRTVGGKRRNGSLNVAKCDQLSITFALAIAIFEANKAII